MTGNAAVQIPGMKLAFRGKVVLSIDVEDWFHILAPESPAIHEWDRLPSRVEQNFRKLLALLGSKGATATCFFLGWVAERYPHLVREAVELGHEVASHGYAHRLVYSMSPREFYEDALRARLLLEDISGLPVYGFRAPGFSVNSAAPWFFREVEAAGYRYDSSVFPAPREHGGWKEAKADPYLVPDMDGLIELPVTTASILGQRYFALGGGYIRLLPEWLVVRLTRKVLREGRPVILYIHPRDIDVDQPRLPLSARRRFKSYVNLHTTTRKLERLLHEFELTSFQPWLSDVLPQGAAASPEAATGTKGA